MVPGLKFAHSRVRLSCVLKNSFCKVHSFFSNLFIFLHFQDEIMSFESEKQAVYLQVYRPVYFQLVDVLLHKAQFPSDQEYASWSSDEKEQFRIYRYSCLCVSLWTVWLVLLCFQWLLSVSEMIC